MFFTDRNCGALYDVIWMMKATLNLDFFKNIFLTRYIGVERKY